MKNLMLLLLVLLSMTATSFSNAQSCIDSNLIDLNSACFDIYQPVCGCNGITYSNSCYALNFGGVTSYTEGPCTGGIVDAEPCSDLGEVDFGECAMYMGITIINQQCVGISGCGWVVDGVNYETASYSSMEECQACLDNNSIDNPTASIIQLFPNPVEDILKIEAQETMNVVKIFNSSGRLVYEQALSNKAISLTTIDWSSGMYFVEILTHNTVHVAKIVVR